MSVTEQTRSTDVDPLRHARMLEGMLDNFTQRKNVTVNLNTPRRME